MTDQQNTTFEQDVERVQDAWSTLWPNPFASGVYKRTRLGDLGHALMNVATESVRRNAQLVAKILVFGPIALAVFVLWQ